MEIKQKNTYVTLCGKVSMFCWLHTYIHTYHVHDVYIYDTSALSIGMSSMGTSYHLKMC
jgi:hypothetical protein